MPSAKTTVLPSGLRCPAPKRCPAPPLTIQQCACVLWGRVCDRDKSVFYGRLSVSIGSALSERLCEGRACEGRPCLAQVFSISVLAQLDDAGLSALGVRAMAARARIQAAARGLCAIVDGVRQVRPRARQFDAFSASLCPPHPLFPRNVKLSILLEYSLLPLLRYRGSAPLGINKN